MSFRLSTAQAVDVIDAAVFSGDEFMGAAARIELRRVMIRWTKQLAELATEDHADKGFLPDAEFRMEGDNTR
jgi:hypothetical protein